MTRPILLVVVSLLIVSLVGCSGPQKHADEPVIGKAAVNDVLGALSGAEVLEAHEEMLPANTVLVAIIDVAYFLDEIMTDGLGMLPSDWDSSEMVTDLSELSTARLGVDINDADQILVAITDDMKAVALIEGDLKMVEGLEKVPHDTVALYKPGEEGLLLADTGKEGVYAMYFDMEHVDMLANVKSGKTPSLKDSTTRGRLMEVLEIAGPGIFSVAVQAGEGELSKMVLNELPMPVDAASIVVSETLTMVIQAKPEVLDALEEAFNAGADSIKQELADEVAEVKDKNFIEGFLTIVAYHTFSGIDEALQPTVEGEVLAMRVGMPSFNSMMPMLVVFAAGAFPILLANDSMDDIQPPEPIAVPSSEPFSAPQPVEDAPSDDAAPNDAAPDDAPKEIDDTESKEAPAPK